MQSIKEGAANIAASAKAGMDKTKATVQEKVEKMGAHDQMEKDLATQKKQDKIHEAEQNKQEARQHNAAVSHTPGVTGYTATGGTGDHMASGPAGYAPPTGAHGHSTTGGHQMSAMPGHGSGEPEGVAHSHPVGINTGTGGTTAQNTRVGGNPAH